MQQEKTPKSKKGEKRLAAALRDNLKRRKAAIQIINNASDLKDGARADIVLSGATHISKVCDKNAE